MQLEWKGGTLPTTKNYTSQIKNLYYNRLKCKESEINIGLKNIYKLKKDLEPLFQMLIIFEMAQNDSVEAKTLYKSNQDYFDNRPIF